MNSIPDVLRQTAAEQGYKEKQLAVYLHITPKTMSRKFNGLDDFKLSEVERLCGLLGLRLAAEKTPDDRI